MATDSMRRGNDFCLVVDTHQVCKSSGMITMPMGNKHIVNHTEVDAQFFCITDKNITCPSIKQNPIFLRLQQNRQAMLRLKMAVIRAII